MEFTKDNPGTWFYFDEDEESKGGVCLRVLSPEESTKIDKLATTKKSKFDRKSHTRYEEVKTDEKLSSRLMWDYIITDWSNITMDSVKLECTTDNKVMLTNNLTFANFLMKSLESLQDDIESGRNLAKN